MVDRLVMMRMTLDALKYVPDNGIINIPVKII